MTIPAELLLRPLIWRDPMLIPLLADLQGNILKGHGRDHTRNLFLRFGDDRAAARRALATLSGEITSAIEQLSATARYRADGTDGGPVRFFFLSARGYRALGIADEKQPPDPAFRAGMAGRPGLADPDAATWDTPFGRDHGPDAMLLIGAHDAAAVDAETERLTAMLSPSGTQVIGTEIGAALRRGGPGGKGIEHFGYIDGRSQPLMLDDDVVRELNQGGGPFVWNPEFGPGQLALVPDPGGTHADCYGSYFVFRKLEQDVAGFDAAEKELARHLDPAHPDLAGALVIGRFEDGTPVSREDHPLGAPHVENNFGFDGSDADGRRCPFAAHIRKTNPRGDTVRQFGAPLEAERTRLMPRRGITYGGRAPDLSDEPAGGVGLLFMAYNQDIARQFEFVQSSWVNAPGFLTNATGGDPVIGAFAGTQRWPKHWNDPAAGTVEFRFADFVRMRGGEYFFAPSLSFFAALAG